MSFSRLDYVQPTLSSQELSHLEADLTMNKWIDPGRVKTLLLDYLRLAENQTLDDAYANGYEDGLEEGKLQGAEEYQRGYDRGREDAKHESEAI